MRARLEQFWADQALFRPGDRVLCAVSGGADSVCLLHLLKETPWLETVCAHFNHRLRGAESDRDEGFVRDLCRSLGLRCVCGSGDVAAYGVEQGLGIEAAARALRYDFLRRTAAELDCGCIATAHNAEDNAETLLLNLLRGSGARGLGGIPPVRDNIVRPLLILTRGEIEAYLQAHGLAHVEDSSNGEDGYARNRIRHRILPLLRAEQPAAVENICAAATLLRQDEEYLSAQAEEFIGEAYRDGALPIPALLALPRPVGARVLLRLCPGAGRAHVQAVYDLCRGQAVHGALDLPGRRLVRERERLCFAPAALPPIPKTELALGETRIPDTSWRVFCREDTFQGEIHKSFNTFCFKRENICDKLYISSRAAGDCIRLAGRGCTKSLKKLFSEARLPLAQRDRIPVLRDGAGVVAVAGFGLAQRCAPQPGDRVLRVEIIEEPERREASGDDRNHGSRYFGGPDL